ncbi:MAG: hypothetical protein PVG25_02960 [Anaerolineae bacterium]|jgi:hypothetical protein
MELRVRPLQSHDGGKVADLVAGRWGSPIIVVHSTRYRPAELPGFVALHNGLWLGLVTYRIAEQECEIVTLDSLKPGVGVATALLNAVQSAARQSRCSGSG